MGAGRDGHRPTELRLDWGALQHNARLLREVAGSARVYLVLKADAYGHGAATAHDLLHGAGFEDFAVARVDDLSLFRTRFPPLPDGRFLILGGVVDHFEGDYALELGVTLAVLHEDQVAVTGDAARRRGVRADVHLEVDTGMRRTGASPSELPAVLARFAATPSLRLAGLFTHFARADEPGAPEVDAQRARFREALAAVRASGLAADDLVVHAANSAALLGGHALGPALPEANAVRPGIALYGISPFTGAAGGPADRLRPVMSLVARVVQTRRLAAGDAVGYGGTWRAPRATTVATVAAGYADGVPWRLAGRGTVTLRGRRVPVVGRVSMDSISVDVGDTDVAAGDEVVVFGQGGQSAAELAQAVETIPYAIVTGVGHRVPRVAFPPPPRPDPALRAARARTRDHLP